MKTQQLMALTASLLLLNPGTSMASSHREAPITALDHKADITDVFAFRSYDAGTPRVTLVMCVDPFLEPGNGPNWFPFDPEILYEIKVDNNNDAIADVTFQFRFDTEQRLPGVFQVMVGADGGISTPANSPSPVPANTPLIPPKNHQLCVTGTRPTPELFGKHGEERRQYRHQHREPHVCSARQRRSADH